MLLQGKMSYQGRRWVRTTFCQDSFCIHPFCCFRCFRAFPHHSSSRNRTDRWCPDWLWMNLGTECEPRVVFCQRTDQWWTEWWKSTFVSVTRDAISEMSDKWWSDKSQQRKDQLNSYRWSIKAADVLRVLDLRLIQGNVTALVCAAFWNDVLSHESKDFILQDEKMNTAHTLMRQLLVSQMDVLTPSFTKIKKVNLLVPVVKNILCVWPLAFCVIAVSFPYFSLFICPLSLLDLAGTSRGQRWAHVFLQAPRVRIWSRANWSGSRLAYDKRETSDNSVHQMEDVFNSCGTQCELTEYNKGSEWNRNTTELFVRVNTTGNTGICL